MLDLLILKSVYFFFPAYFANMVPVLVKKIPFLGKPINESKFGKNKTWRGLIFGTLIGVLVFWLQKLGYQKGFTSLALIDYNGFSVLLGFLMGFGALIGDLVESYYKRRRNIPPGKVWIPWDQLDFVFGAIIFEAIVYTPPFSVIVILLVLSPLLHMLANYLGYLLKFNKSKI